MLLYINKMRVEPLFWGYQAREDGEILTSSNDVVRKYNMKDYYHVRLTSPNGDKNVYAVNRLIAHVFVPNKRPDLFKLVDHIDRDKHNNVFTNLRWTNHSLNGYNNDAKNAFYNKRWRKWIARVGRKTLGCFKTYEEAHRVAKRFRLRLIDETYKKLCAEDSDEMSSNYFSETPDRYPTLVF